MFWLGETISLLGTQVTNLAVPLTAIYTFHATDEQVGILRFLQLAPYVGFALFFGVWVDRHRRRAVMLWTNLVRMLLLTAIPVLSWVHGLNLSMLLLCACAIGIASVLFDVSWMPYVPTLIKHTEQYVEANAKVAMSYSASSAAGPGLAGVLVAAMTAPMALLVDAFSYAASICSLLLIRAPEPRPTPPAQRNVLRELGDGVHWVFSRPILRWLALVGFGCNFSMTSVWTMFLLYGTHELRLNSFTLGLIFAISSLGAVIGAMAVSRVIKRFPLGRVYFIAMGGLLLSPMVIALAGGPTTVIVCLVILSFFTAYSGLGVANVIVVTVRQAATPQPMMSRMTACFRTLLFGGGALGGLSAGLMAAWIGDRRALAAVAIASGAVVLALIVSPVTRLRDLPPAMVDRRIAGSHLPSPCEPAPYGTRRRGWRSRTRSCKSSAR